MPKGVYPKSEEHKRKLSLSTAQAWAEGRLHSHSCSEETRRKCALSAKRRYRTDPTLRERITNRTREAMAQLKASPEYQAMCLKRNRNIARNPEWRKKKREITLRLAQDPEYIAKITPNAETKAKISKRIKKLYEDDPTYRDRVSAATKEAMQQPEVRKRFMDYIARRSQDPEWFRKVMLSRRPTDIEQAIINIIVKYSLPYKYTGDGTFIIGSLNPDFVNVNGDKTAIDIFGDYWHDISEVTERKAIFAKYGWRLTIIWGHEINSLSEEEIVDRIKQ